MHSDHIANGPTPDGASSARSKADHQAIERHDKSTVWHAFSQMASYDGLIIERGDGCWLTDIYGKRYLDAASSLWCNMHGHANSTINEAIITQLSKVAHVTNLGMSHPETIRLAERLVALSPRSLEHVFYCSDGASAVEVAMKIAFQYWRQCESPQPQKTKFIALGNAYHGDTLGTVALGGVERFHSLFKPLLFPVLRGPCPKGRSCDQLLQSSEGRADSSQLCDEYLSDYAELLASHHEEIVAVVVEPLLQCSAGMVFHPPGFLAGIANLCKRYGVLLIVDEIAVGMGRTGALFPSSMENVEPDLLCIGKGLTGGYLPMSATLTSRQIFNAFLGDADRTLYHGHTYGGNPLAAASANACLDLTQKMLSSPEWSERVEQLREGLMRLSQLPGVHRVDQLGLLATVDLEKQDTLATLSSRAVALSAKEVCQSTVEMGVWLRPLGNCIPIVPPLSISRSELATLIDTLESALQSATNRPSNVGALPSF